MSAVFIIFAVLLLLINCALVAMILLQKKRSSGMSGAVTGMGSSGSTYWDKNKGRSFEGQLEKYTKIAGLLFFICTLFLSFLR